MSAHAGPKIVTNGLSLYLDAGNTESYPRSGNTWIDLSVSVNNGVLTSGPTFNSNFQGYFSFDGVNDEVTTTSTHTGINTTNFALCGWFRTSTASGRKIIGFQNNQTGTGVTNYDKHVYVDTNGKLVFGIYNGTANYITSTNSVNDNKWHYFVAAYKTGAGCELFIDGSSVGTMAANSNDTEAYIRIAGYALQGWTNAGNGYFTGDIANIGLYKNIILTSSQIRQNFNALRGRYGI